MLPKRSAKPFRDLIGKGAYVPQLRKLTISYSSKRSDSKGMISYINEKSVELAEQNPNCVINVQHRLGWTPYFLAEYLNGYTRKVAVNNMSVKEIERAVRFLKGGNGYQIVRFKKWWHTSNPTIQGNWNPFMHMHQQHSVVPERPHVTQKPHLPGDREQIRKASVLLGRESNEMHLLDIEDKTVENVATEKVTIAASNK